jgi:hypothetical protein
MDFTGSDWCGWCVRLKEEVFSKESFKTGAPKNFVLVELDYPKKTEQPEAIKKQNKALARKYAVQGFPTILLADASGKPYARTGYKEGGAEKYLAHLDEMRANKTKMEAVFTRAETKKKAEKALVLEEAIELLAANGLEKEQKVLIDQIKQLDGENKAGLKAKYENRERIGGFYNKLRQTRDADAVLKEIDAFLADAKLESRVRQEALHLKGSIHMSLKDDILTGIKFLRQALEADPNTDTAKEIKGVLKSMVGKDDAETIARHKQRRALGAINRSLSQNRNWDKGIADIDAFIAKEKPSAPVLQEALFFRARILIHGKKDTKQGLAALEKAKAAAPDTELARQIAEQIKQVKAQAGHVHGPDCKHDH